MDNSTLPLNSSNHVEMKVFPVPPEALDVVGLGVIFVMTFLSNAGGLAGGGILIPLMMIFFRLPIFECVPIANVFGLLASTTRFITNFKQKHPNKKWQITIDYELVQLSMPLLYLGTLVGVNIGTLITEIQLAILLEAVLLFVTVKTAQKAKQMYNKEKIQLQQQLPLPENNHHNLELKALNTGSKQLIESEAADIELKQQEMQQTRELQEILKNEGKHFPMKRTANFILTLIFLFITSMLLGNKYQKERLVEKEMAWFILAMFIAYCIASTIYNARLLRRIHVIKRRDNYHYDPTDLSYNSNKDIFKVVIISFVAGCLGGIVGIAGGIILGPILLQMGMLPILVGGTNQFLAMISSISVSSQFIYMGVLNYQYAAILGVFVVVSAYLGNTQVNRIVKLTGKQSIIVIILAFVLMISAISLPLKYIFK